MRVACVVFIASVLCCAGRPERVARGVTRTVDMHEHRVEGDDEGPMRYKTGGAQVERIVDNEHGVVCFLAMTKDEVPVSISCVQINGVWK